MKKQYAFLLIFSISVFSFELSLQSLDIRHSEANSTIFVVRTETGLESKSQVTATPPRPRPKPCPIFGKKRKISEDISDSQAFGTQKRTRSGNFSSSFGDSSRGSSLIAAPVKDIRQALCAQHEPQPAAINDLRMYSLTFQPMHISYLTIISSYSVISDTILVVSFQTITITYLSPMRHQLRLRGLDARGSTPKWVYPVQYHSETTIRCLQVNA